MPRENATTMITDALKRGPNTVGEIEGETGLANTHIRTILGTLCTVNLVGITRDPDSGLNRYRITGRVVSLS